MNQFLLVLAVALTVALIVFGITVLVTGEDAGLAPVEPDGRAIPLPADRPLGESDLAEVRFDTVLRGYRMAQVDTALRRAAYDIGYKDELIRVLRAEVDALREGRLPEAEVLRRAREAAQAPPAPADPPADPAAAPGDRPSQAAIDPPTAPPAAGDGAAADAAEARAGVAAETDADETRQ